METQTKDEKLSGRSLDAAVDAAVFDQSIAWENGKPFRLSPAADPGQWIVPNYSESSEAAMEVEDRIAKLGLQSEYYRALVDIVCRSITDRLFHLFDVVHATPEQRCLAALKAVETKS